MKRSERLDVVQQAAARTERERAERVGAAERHLVEMEQKLAALEKYRKEYEDGFAARAGAGLDVIGDARFPDVPGASRRRAGAAAPDGRAGARRARGRRSHLARSRASARTWSTRWRSAGRAKRRARKAAATSSDNDELSQQLRFNERANHDFQCRAEEHRSRRRRRAGRGRFGDAGDTGAFDALLALQSMVGRRHRDRSRRAAGRRARRRGAAAIARRLRRSRDDAEASPDDALCVSRRAAAHAQRAEAGGHRSAAGASASVPIQNDAVARERGSATRRRGCEQHWPTSSPRRMALNRTRGDADSKPRVPRMRRAPTPVIDTTTWNSMSGARGNVRAWPRVMLPERVESAALTTHVRDPRWADDLGNRLASMVRAGESSASLQLTPVDLGPLEVNVAVRDNQATVHFGAANAETRALLEASIPRLREMLAAQGFQLMDSSVSQGFARQTRHEVRRHAAESTPSGKPRRRPRRRPRTSPGCSTSTPERLAARRPAFRHAKKPAPTRRHCVTPLTLRTWHARCTIIAVATTFAREDSMAAACRNR